jgi:hypothetical protein
MVGLWIGLSSLSFVQILEFMAEALKDKIRNLSNNKCSPSGNPYKEPTQENMASPCKSPPTDVTLCAKGSMTPVDI